MNPKCINMESRKAEDGTFKKTQMRHIMNWFNIEGAKGHKDCMY